MITAMNTHATTIEMPRPADSHQACFACGTSTDGGLKLHFDIDSDGVASAVWQPSPAFQSYPDRLHGGVIATLLDSAIVHALFAKNVAGVTAELTIRYLISVGLDTPVRVTGRVVSKRHGVYLCHAEVHQNGECFVRASAKFMAMASLLHNRCALARFPMIQSQSEEPNGGRSGSRRVRSRLPPLVCGPSLPEDC